MERGPGVPASRASGLSDEARSRARAYARVAPVYEALARGWSLGAIPRAKASQVPRLAGLRRDDPARVLYVGCGRGEDALLAARAGLRVAALDACPSMLAGLRRRLDAEKLEADLHCADFADFVPERPYDAVVANFFLNVFDPRGMREALERVCSWVTAGGCLAVADFAPPSARPGARLLQWLHYAPVALVCRGIGLASLHGLYDYAEELRTLGWEVERRERFGTLALPLPLPHSEERVAPRARGGEAFYESLIARRR